MKPFCLLSMVKTGFLAVMMVGDIFFAHFCPFSPFNHYLNTSRSNYFDHVHPFLTSKITCDKVQIISNQFLKHDIESNVLKWAPLSPNLNPLEHIWDVNMRQAPWMSS